MLKKSDNIYDYLILSGATKLSTFTFNDFNIIYIISSYYVGKVS